MSAAGILISLYLIIRTHTHTHTYIGRALESVSFSEEALCNTNESAASEKKKRDKERSMRWRESKKAMAEREEIMANP